MFQALKLIYYLDYVCINKIKRKMLNNNNNNNIGLIDC